MSHSVRVTLIGNQCLNLLGREINIHDIRSIMLDGENVCAVCLNVFDFDRLQSGYEWIEKQKSDKERSDEQTDQGRR